MIGSSSFAKAACYRPQTMPGTPEMIKKMQSSRPIRVALNAMKASSSPYLHLVPSSCPELRPPGPALDPWSAGGADACPHACSKRLIPPIGMSGGNCGLVTGVHVSDIPSDSLAVLLRRRGRISCLALRAFVSRYLCLSVSLIKPMRSSSMRNTSALPSSSFSNSNPSQDLILACLDDSWVLGGFFFCRVHRDPYLAGRDA